MISKCLGYPATPTVLINMLVTSTPDGPATDIYSKTHMANTSPEDPMTTSTNDKVNAPPTLTADQKILLGPCRGWISSANVFPRDYSMAKCPHMR